MTLDEYVQAEGWEMVVATCSACFHDWKAAIYPQPSGGGNPRTAILECPERGAMCADEVSTP